MSKQALERKLEALRALRSGDSGAWLPELRKFVRDRNNYVVSKAAGVAADLNLTAMTPDLLIAFDRFFADPVKSDPQCWAKNAIVQALVHLGHRHSKTFLKGIDYFQFEPVWNGREDTAATLRGASALALVNSELDWPEVMCRLVDRMADPATPVRLDAAVAISQLGRPEGTLILRLKALLGDPEPEVTGQCFLSLSALSPEEAVPFLARFVLTKDGVSEDEEVRAEAIAALAQSRQPDALEVIKKLLQNPLTREARTAVLLSLGASPRREALEFVFSVLREASADAAEAAVIALGASRFREEFRKGSLDAVEEKGDASLRRAFSRAFGAVADA